MISHLCSFSLPASSKLISVLLLAILVTIISGQPVASDNCLNYNSNNSVCTECFSGYYLEYYFCVPCNPRCACSSQYDYC